jgi:hypothetical protein
MTGPEPTAICVGPPAVSGSVGGPDISIRGIIDPYPIRGKIIIKIGCIHSRGIIPVILFIIALILGRRVSLLGVRHIVDTTCSQHNSKHNRKNDKIFFHFLSPLSLVFAKNMPKRPLPDIKQFLDG